MKKYLPYIFLIALCVYGFTSLNRGFEQIDYEFKGIVQKVIYKSSNNNPIIVVNNKQYDLEYLKWADDSKRIEAGDSVMKKKGSQMISLFKK
ncbi:MAG: hypothetical protein JWR50_1207 [Mucilaginibacter sp.]|jgi:hypothetical protein|nr:hypothetical protein [Mucilaginibacter sp.]